MTREHTRLVQLGEYQAQRDLAQEVGCPGCDAVIGRPCQNRWGEPLPMEHPARIAKARRLRERGESECGFCQRLRLTPQQRESTPWPDQIRACAAHRRVMDEIDEAREMEQQR